MKAILGGALALALVSESAAVAACTAKVVGNDFVIDGCNLVVRNGSGSTSTVNGLGNVIIGYDAPNTVDGFPKGRPDPTTSWWATNTAIRAAAAW